MESSQPPACQPAVVATRRGRPWAALARRLAATGLRGGEVSAIWRVEARTAAAVPVVAFLVACGFPSPAEDYLDPALDFNELLGAGRASIFVMEAAGESMAPLIRPKDRLVIDRAASVTDGAVIVALLAGEFTLKRYRRKGAFAWLEAENPAFARIPLSDDCGFEVWGVVTDIVRRLRWT